MKKKKAIIIIIIIIAILVGVGIILLISNNKETKQIGENSSNNTVGENTNQLQQKRETVFQEVSKEMQQYDITLIDVEFEENSDNIVNLLVEKETSTRKWNWDKIGIPEQSYSTLDSSYKRDAASIYGPAYTTVEEELFAIVPQSEIESLKTKFPNSKYDSLKDILTFNKWTGFKYNWIEKVTTNTNEITTNNIDKK